MKKKNKFLILIFILAFLGLYTMVYIIPSVAGALKKTMVLEYGNLPIADQIEGYIVRDETLYLADKTGEIQYFVGEGIKTRKGVRILNIKPQKMTESSKTLDLEKLSENIGKNGEIEEINDSKTTGLVGYFVDGYEKIFSPENMLSLSRTKVEALDMEIYNLTREEGVLAVKGEPIYKILDNNQWYVMFWLDKDSAAISNYEKEKTVRVKMEHGDIAGKIYEVKEQKDGWQIVISFDRYYEDLPKLRKVEATVVLADYEGLIVKNEGLIKVDGKLGVYGKQRNGQFEFVPVNVLKSSGSHSILSIDKFIDDEGKEVKTVKIYEEILQKPEHMKKKN